MKLTAGFRKTKIVCTIGPATDSVERMQELMHAGMDVARLNFSHGDRESHRRTIRSLRQVAGRLGREIGIIQDLGGPKIRAGVLPGGERVLKTGDQVALSSGENFDSEVIPVNYPYFAEDVSVGDRILMADGTVELTVEKKEEERIVCRITVGGVIQSRKGINLPSSNLRVPAFTDKDREDLQVGLEEKVDFVALSFVRHERDIEPVRRILDEVERRPMIIAKIEKPQAVERLDAILAAVDAVMVARGDLGVEMPLEEVPSIQKRIIRVARQTGKPVITATQMLRSMMENPRPTRAEAADIANAVLDGTDALMLSDETAMGAFPMEAVGMLDRIARSTELHMDESHLMEEAVDESLPKGAAAISRAATRLALDLEAAAIVASTSSGSTARLVARFRSPFPVVALTPYVETQRQLSLSWGVIADQVESFKNTDDMFDRARSWVVDRNIARPGDCLVITAGIPIGVKGTTNLLRVIEL